MILNCAVILSFSVAANATISPKAKTFSPVIINQRNKIFEPSFSDQVKAYYKKRDTKAEAKDNDTFRKKLFDFLKNYENKLKPSDFAENIIELSAEAENNQESAVFYAESDEYDVESSSKSESKPNKVDGSNQIESLSEADIYETNQINSSSEAEIPISLIDNNKSEKKLAELVSSSRNPDSNNKKYYPGLLKKINELKNTKIDNVAIFLEFKLKMKEEELNIYFLNQSFRKKTENPVVPRNRNNYFTKRNGEVIKKFLSIDSIWEAHLNGSLPKKLFYHYTPIIDKIDKQMGIENLTGEVIANRLENQRKIFKMNIKMYNDYLLKQRKEERKRARDF